MASAYLTPDEARGRGVAWQPRPGEPADLSNEFHYQSPDESKALGREWASQPAIASGNARHAGFTPDMSLDQLMRMQYRTPAESAALFGSTPLATSMPSFGGPDTTEGWLQRERGLNRPLPPGVPPGSVRVEGGYQTPDGQIISDAQAPLGTFGLFDR